MSGPKEARIQPSQQRLARRQLAPLIPQLDSARATLTANPTARCVDIRRQLDSALKDLRTELAKFQGTPETRAKLLAAVCSMEGCSARLVATAKEVPSAGDIDALTVDIKNLISGRSDLAIDSLESMARAFLNRTGLHAAAHREAVSTLDAASKLLALPNKSALETQKAVNELFFSARAAVQNESRDLAAEDLNLLSLGAFDPKAHSTALQSALTSFDSGDVAAATRFTEQARMIRMEARLLGSARQTAIEMRDEIAHHLATTLEERNYDKCLSYLKEGPGGEERPLVIYANNPAGTAHVRITLPLNDQMTIEVEGVADGEEEICVDVLEAFRSALKAADNEMDLIDSGRAASALARTRVRRIEREREREGDR
jgi:hypothetical protein